jgi:hypothetical protein
MDEVVLEYIGNENGGTFIFGVPACNLTAEMIEACGLKEDELLAFQPPVYKRPGAPVAPDAPAEGGE